MVDHSNPWKLSVFLLVGIIVGYGFGQILPMASEVSLLNVDDDTEPVVIEVGGEEDVEVEDVVDVSVDDDDMLGDPDAPITIIEFSDFQCPYCQRFHVNTFGQLKENYIDTGKVNFVYRDYPLSFHANALPAAEATECAGEQDSFWEMYEMVFDNLDEWADAEEADALFAVYATEIGLDVSEFESCLASDAMVDEIKADMQDGIAYGVTATPTFFVNGQRVVGAQPYSVFSSIIDSLLGE